MNEVSTSLRQSIKQIRNGSSKGDYTKTREGTNQMESKFLDQSFTINHSSNARGSDSCVLTDFQEMFWETIC